MPGMRTRGPTGSKSAGYEELAAISHRGYCTGFYFGDPQQTAANLDDVIRPGYRFVAKVTGQSPDVGERRYW